jgi:hypothetical protein
VNEITTTKNVVGEIGSNTQGNETILSKEKRK